MSKKHAFKGSFINVLKHNKDGSFRTQDDRRKILLETADTLWSMGYKLDGAKFIRTRHIYKLIDHWKANGNEAGTLRNKAAALRWLMEKFNKAEVVPDNKTLKIPKRQYLTNKDKSRDLTNVDLEQINKPLRKMSLQGQKLFGLRVEESLKIQPHVADCGDRLFLKASWTKGGRERFIPIRTQEQRQWLDEAKALVKYKEQSLIPPEKSYKTYRNTINQYFRRKGICKTHGLRHQYAQTLYKELTGWESPAKGGPSRKQLSPEQKLIDRNARLELSALLGHCRISIVAQYCGQ
ncbi:MAG: integrase [Gammaproteobacteria bacterium CG11_big_fil_rev_8_21_14_0_20_46_22]|nr:MAG: integrase [Gammaproteobacteria bacterium CG12_big_fil_rev_8_21_14_0_65_46_12]PIR11751.1 MAG: integrase [Gammaproteobacteria bacterium CG11_big_fil_rev_8_21_14_0_20_46_22]